MLALDTNLPCHLRVLSQHLRESLDMNTEVADLCRVDYEISIPALELASLLRKLPLKVLDQVTLRCKVRCWPCGGPLGNVRRNAGIGCDERGQSGVRAEEAGDGLADLNIFSSALAKLSGPSSVAGAASSLCAGLGGAA